MSEGTARDVSQDDFHIGEGHNLLDDIANARGWNRNTGDPYTPTELIEHISGKILSGGLGAIRHSFHREEAAIFTNIRYVRMMLPWVGADDHEGGPHQASSLGQFLQIAILALQRELAETPKDTFLQQLLAACEQKAATVK